MDFVNSGTIQLANSKIAASLFMRSLLSVDSKKVAEISIIVHIFMNEDSNQRVFITGKRTFLPFKAIQQEEEYKKRKKEINI